MSRTKVIQSAFGAVFLASACLSSPAIALDNKQCLPMAEMNAALRAEGQRTMIIGDRVYIDNPTGDILDVRIPRFVNTVTSNADGSLGYQLEGDKPRAQTSDKVCVGAKLTNVRLFDASKPGVNQAALLGGKFNEAIINAEKGGLRPMVIADSVHRDTNGDDRVGLPVVILGNMELKAGGMVSREADGRAMNLLRLTSLEYTPAGLSRLNPQVAMVSPK